MTLSDFMFLCEIVVEELYICIGCKEFSIRSQFADVFSLILKTHNESVAACVPKRTKQIKKKLKVNTKNIQKTPFQRKVQTGQLILSTNNIDILISKMNKYPIELSIWSIADPKYKIGSIHIPWSHQYIDFLGNVNRKLAPYSVLVDGYYNIFNELTFKHVATIKLSIKLSHLKDRTQFRYISEKNMSIMNCKENNKLDDAKAKDTKKKIKDLVIKENTNEMFSKDNTGVYRKINLVKSDPVIHKSQEKFPNKIKSCSSLKHFNGLSYIFGDENSFGKKVYCVHYFTVEKYLTSSVNSLKGQSCDNKDKSEKPTKVKLCDCRCPNKTEIESSCTRSYSSSDLPTEPDHLINVTDCQQIDCVAKKYYKTESSPDDQIFLDTCNIQKQCCAITQPTEKVVEGMLTKTKIGEESCFCSCECTFGFTKKTVYCKVCGGYETIGDEVVGKLDQDPFPCPIFHTLIDKDKQKTWSTSGSDIKKRNDDNQKKLKSASKLPTEKLPIVTKKNAESEDSKKDNKERKGDHFKFNYGHQALVVGHNSQFTMNKIKSELPTEKRPMVSEKNAEPENYKKYNKKKKNDHFKFNYDYQAPHMGHGQCIMPCNGMLGAVPKSMGWLWTSEDIPGMKYRPLWKPGATNKQIVTLLHKAKNPDVVMLKKKRKYSQLKKRSLKRPLLVVHKKDGEYTVTMETMKTFTKPRTFNQYPYENKPVLTYTIGRTDEENRDRRKKKEREQRRLEKAQRQYIQSAFRDICQEICLKSYQQALGILPDTENLESLYNPAQADGDKVNLDLCCSRSDEKSSIVSDTDSDEWIVEFTPPNATFDPSYKSKKIIKVDNTTQYTYLDYKVKLVDRFGNPVPRYFKGPDGKQQCSDLGGFWSPDHKWLEINIDGYIAPDGKWAPNNFIGPNEEQVDAEMGKFQSNKGKWLVVGVDGYVDAQGKWRFYPKPRGQVALNNRQYSVAGGKKSTVDKQLNKTKRSEATWSCFGDISQNTYTNVNRRVFT